MARLWDEERQHNSRSLSLETLSVLGGAQEIVRTHLDSALRKFSDAERYALTDLFRQLVTPSGTKIAHSAADLAEYVELSAAEITELLERLARPETRLVRAVAPPLGDRGPPRYEIFHDVLATSILDWVSRQTAVRRAEEQRRVARAAVRRRLVWLVAVVATAAFAVIVLLAIEANYQRNQARVQARNARFEASRAGRSAKLANQTRRLAMEVALFQVGYSQKATYITRHGHLRVLVRTLGVVAPKGTVVDVSCVPARCRPWRRTFGGPAARTILVSTLAGRSLPVGTHVIIFASSSDIAETITLLATHPGGLANINEIRCRPIGSHIPGSDLSGRCPSVTSRGQAKRSTATIRLLGVSGRGFFHTKGRYAAATVRG
jgi:hypothetical protein